MKFILASLVLLSGCTADYSVAQAAIDRATTVNAQAHAATTQAVADFAQLKSQATTQPSLAGAVAVESKVVDTSIQAEAIAAKSLADAQAVLSSAKSGTIDPALIAIANSLPSPYGPIAGLLLVTVGPSLYSLWKSHQANAVLAASLADSVPASVHASMVAAASIK